MRRPPPGRSRPLKYCGTQEKLRSSGAAEPGKFRAPTRDKTAPVDRCVTRMTRSKHSAVSKPHRCHSSREVLLRRYCRLANPSHQPLSRRPRSHCSFRLSSRRHFRRHCCFRRSRPSSHLPSRHLSPRLNPHLSPHYSSRPSSLRRLGHFDRLDHLCRRRAGPDPVWISCDRTSTSGRCRSRQLPHRHHHRRHSSRPSSRLPRRLQPCLHHSSRQHSLRPHRLGHQRRPRRCSCHSSSRLPPRLLRGSERSFHYSSRFRRPRCQDSCRHRSRSPPWPPGDQGMTTEGHKERSRKGMVS